MYSTSTLYMYMYSAQFQAVKKESLYICAHVQSEIIHVSFPLIGTCNVCQKPIENSQNLFSFASRLYHTKCFCCTQCGKHM